MTVTDRFIGREVSAETRWNPMREESRWVGKPWRRIELLTRRYFYRGEQTDVERDLTVHFGLRRLGLALTVNLIRAPCLDYSEEQQ